MVIFINFAKYRGVQKKGGWDPIILFLGARVEGMKILI